MSKVYICHTPYHILITLIKTIEDKEKSSILVYKSLNNYENIIKKLKESNIFNEVKLFNCENDNEFFNLTYEFKYKHLFKHKRVLKKLENTYDFNILKNKDIYIYNDDSVVGYYMQLAKINYNLLEDGLDCYKNIDRIYRYNYNIYEKIKRFLGFGLYRFGNSKYSKTIEVNDKKDINLPIKNKLIEVPRKELFERLTEKQKKLILGIFLQEDDIIKVIKGNSTLVITQPLFEDKLVDSKEKQIKIYKDIVQNYSIGKVIIKPHPRDTLNYEKYFKDCIVIKEKYIPLEILNFIPNLKIKRAVTVFSTAIQSIDYCDEKICFGIEWAINHE